MNKSLTEQISFTLDLTNLAQTMWARQDYIEKLSHDNFRADDSACLPLDQIFDLQRENMQADSECLDALRGDYVEEEEEEEEVWASGDWDETDEEYDPNPFDTDDYDIALNGQEEAQALLQLENEHDGYSRGGDTIL